MPCKVRSEAYGTGLQDCFPGSLAQGKHLNLKAFGGFCQGERAWESCCNVTEAAGSKLRTSP